MVKLVKAERFGNPAVAVEVDGERIGYVYKSVEETHVMAKDRGLRYSVGTTRRTVYRLDTVGGLLRTPPSATFRRRADAVEYLVDYVARRAAAKEA